MFTLRLLGTVALGNDGGRDVPRGATQPRRLALLAALATAAGDGLSRDQLAGLFWPGEDQERARHNVADVLYRLRRALGEDAIRTDGDRVLLDSGLVRTDVGEFETHLDAGDPEAAVAVYGGPFIEGFFLPGAPRAFEEWVDQQRRRLGRLHEEALEELAARAEASGDPGASVEWWQRLTELDPYNTRYAVGLVDALARAGDPAGALRHARRHGALLEREFGLARPPELSAAVSAIEGRVRSPRTGGAPRDELHEEPGLPGAARETEGVEAPGPGVADTRSAEAVDAPLSEGRDALEAGEADAVETRAVATAEARRVDGGGARAAAGPAPPRAGHALRRKAVVRAAALVVLGLVAASGAIAMWRGEGRPARFAVERLLTDDPEARDAFLLAQEIRSRPGDSEGRWDSARVQYERALRLDPAFALAHAELSELHSRVLALGIDVSGKRARLALHHAERALELVPDLPEGYRALGHYYRWGPHQYERALEAFEKAGFPDDADLLRLKGLVYRRQGRWEESTRSLERAARMDPDDTGAFYQVLFNHLFLGRFRDLEDAAAGYRDRAPNDPLGSLWAAAVPALREDDFSSLRDLLFPVGDTEPRCPHRDALDVCWDALIAMGRPDAALRLAESYPDAWVFGHRLKAPRALLAASSLATLGRHEEARTAFREARSALEEAVLETPDDAALRAALARASVGLGRADEAMQQARRAVELLPLSRDAMRGTFYLLELAAVQAAAGERRQALETLASYLSVPSELPPSWIARDPRFAPLRGMPEYAELVDAY